MVVKVFPENILSTKYKLFEIQSINSLKYTAPKNWNSILKIDKTINPIKNSYSLGKFLKKHFLSLYESN